MLTCVDVFLVCTIFISTKKVYWIKQSRQIVINKNPFQYVGTIKYNVRKSY